MEKAEPTEFSKGLVVRHKLKQGRKDNSRVWGLTSMKVKSCHLEEALPDCLALPLLLRADPRSS